MHTHGPAARQALPGPDSSVQLPADVAAELRQTAQDERHGVSRGWGRLYTGLLSSGLSRPLAQSLWLVGQESNRLRRQGKLTNGCLHPGKAGLARVLRASESTARRHLRELRRLGLVELVEQGGGWASPDGRHSTRPGSRGGRGLANVLRVTPEGWSVLAARSVVENAQEKRGGRRSPKGVHFDPPSSDFQSLENKVAPEPDSPRALPGTTEVRPAGAVLSAPSGAPFAPSARAGGREAARRGQPQQLGGALARALVEPDTRARPVTTTQTRPANYSPTPRRDPEADAAPWAKYLRDPVPGDVVVDVDTGSHVLTRCPCTSCTTWRAYSGRRLPGDPVGGDA